MLKPVFFLFYRFIFMPLALTIVFLVLWPFHGKIKRGLALRKNQKLHFDFKEKPIWFHASSGEFEYAKPVIKAIKEWRPDVPIVVTYFSPSYSSAIESFPGVEHALALPLDLPAPVGSFLQKLNPALLLVARTDFWPELLRLTKARNIPTLLFSSTFRPLHGGRKVFKPYFKMIFSFFNDVFAVSEIDRKSISDLCAGLSVKAIGDTRYDQVVSRLKKPKAIRLEILKDRSQATLIAGSTWPEDEEALLKAFQELRRHDKELRLILAPHEPTDAHLQEIETRWHRVGVECIRYTKATAFSAPVLLVDQIGILAELYQHADIAFVGGSFKRKVHSVMEPLAAGRPTIIGPFHKNNREAVEFQSVSIQPGLTAVTAVEDWQHLARAITHALAESKRNSAVSDAIRGEIESRTGASKLVLDWVAQHY